MSAESHTADLRGARSQVETRAAAGTAAQREPVAEHDGESAPQASGRLLALELFGAILAVLVVSLGAFQLHFTLPVVGFVLFLIIVVAAVRLGFWQATVTSVVAVGCLDF